MELKENVKSGDTSIGTLSTGIRRTKGEDMSIVSSCLLCPATFCLPFRVDGTLFQDWIKLCSFYLITFFSY